MLFRLSLTFGDRRFAWIAALVVTSQGVSLVYYGRQVLGEVPGLLFLLGGLVLWFAAGERAGYAKLSLIGLLFGLAVVTKNQYLLLMVPTIGIAWVVNLITTGSCRSASSSCRASSWASVTLCGRFTLCSTSGRTRRWKT
ncbi:MAG: hypothetical protein R2856_28710 [Caldilineaceae bacterium]